MSAPAILFRYEAPVTDLAEREDIPAVLALQGHCGDASAELFRVSVKGEEVANGECVGNIGLRSVNIHPLAARLPFEPDMLRNVSEEMTVRGCHDDSTIPGTQGAKSNTVLGAWQYTDSGVSAKLGIFTDDFSDLEKLDCLSETLERDFHWDEVRPAVRNAHTHQIFPVKVDDVDLERGSNQCAFHAATPSNEVTDIAVSTLTQPFRGFAVNSVEIRRAA